MPKAKTRRITYNLPIVLIDKINSTAKQRGVPKVEVVREVMTTSAFLKVNLNAAPRKKAPAKKKKAAKKKPAAKKKAAAKKKVTPPSQA